MAIRSCASSGKIWQQDNPKYPVLNYSLLGYDIAGKLTKKHIVWGIFSQEAEAGQQNFF